MENRFISILVVGNCENIRLYDSDFKNDKGKIIKMYYDDAEKERKKLIKSLLYSRNMLKESEIFDYSQLDVAISKLTKMTDIGFLVNFNPNCDFDDKCNAIYKNSGFPTYYSHAVCYDDRLRYFGEEGPMVTPFKLVDGTIAYISEKKNIDWEYMHGRNKELYGKVWDMCVNGLQPNTKEDELLYESMKNREKYFSNFSSKEDYIIVSTSFWCHALIEENGNIHIINPEKSHVWAENFFNNFILPLDGSTQLSLYEAKLEIEA